ncbi:Gfo/Idh/MocA family oxidoreductase [candidate division KSB1 bacterium]|nr:Gfo/Idh/MocA family oxidoreductase [candidate division KSB1 bacterium]
MKKEQNKNESLTKNRHLSRRQFMATSGTAALSFTIINPNLIQSSQANSKIKLGLIGCGGRGTWITNLFQNYGGYEIIAAADYFEDRVNAFGDRFNIPSDRRFTGLSCYKQLLDSKVAAVAIESPPYFHPEQAAAAIDAGSHVYLAKPIAVDIPGCNSVSESGKKATEKKLCLLVDFQTRANEYFIEAINRVHNGDIGDFAFGESSYHAGSPWKRVYDILKADPNNPENRLRAWGLDRALSGDIITEQNIHTIDVMNWIMNEPPLFAVGTGGHKVRPDQGNCWDHFALTFQYRNNVGITFSSRQFEGHGSVPDGIRNRMFGSKGVLETKYGGQVIIRGENFYRGGKTNDIYKQGANNNIAAFYKNIIEGKYDNSTVTPSVQSNKITIMGRTAAYEGRPVYWHQIVNTDERLEPRLEGLID